jgi:hypothetical protein
MNRYLLQERGRTMSLSEEELDRLVAGERARLQAPLNDWRTIAARAREEGLIRDSKSRGWISGQPWMRAAAAVLLLVGGIAIGRTTTGLPDGSQSALSINAPTPENNSVTPTPAPSGMTASTPASFASVEEASATLDRAVEDYKRASQFLAANNSYGATRDSSALLSARLAALNQVVNATESALHTAPQDPVINQYYLATMGARVATQQLVARQVGLRGF